MALLINKAIKKFNFIMVDTGLMRKMNLNIPIAYLKKYKLNVKLLMPQIVLQKLSKINDPEKKKSNLKIVYRII